MRPLNNINIISSTLYDTIPKCGHICRSGCVILVCLSHSVILVCLNHSVILVCLSHSAHQKSRDEKKQKTLTKNNIIIIHNICEQWIYINYRVIRWLSLTHPTSKSHLFFRATSHLVLGQPPTSHNHLDLTSHFLSLGFYWWVGEGNVSWAIFFILSYD